MDIKICQNNDPDKTCESCEFFRKHYTILNSNLIYTNCGHCMKHLKTIHISSYACKRWQKSSANKNEEKENLIAMLKKAINKIETIAYILTSDNFDK